MKYLKSPMNYIGNKYRLLNQMIPLFPETDNFVDLFAGGLDVSINYNAKNIYCNDINYHLIDIYKAFQTNEYDSIIKKFDETIAEYGLSKENAEGYTRFRDYYNHSNRNPLDLYLLMNYSFNYQLRFNLNHDFNNPFGKNRSSFNNAIRNRLPIFMEKIQAFNFSSKDFREFDYSVLHKGDLIYCDPPYTISTGSYNDGKRGFKGWCEQDDIDLMNILDELSERGVYFAFSNVLVHKGKINEVLRTWAKKYTIHYLNFDYNNSSYHLKAKSETQEVLITNE